jgi:hypothetical protein
MSRVHQLPRDANLRRFGNQAKDLCRACRKGEPNAVWRIGQTHPSYSGLTLAEIAAVGIVLAEAQLVVARELGFDSWPKLKKHFESRQTTSMRELGTEDNVKALQEALAQDSQSAERIGPISASLQVAHDQTRLVMSQRTARQQDNPCGLRFW